MLTEDDKIFISRIVQRIKELRNKKAVSQRELYFSTNVSIGRIEQGKENIKLTTLLAICRYFNISLSEFLKDIEKELPQKDD